MRPVYVYMLCFVLSFECTIVFFKQGFIYTYNKQFYGENYNSLLFTNTTHRNFTTISIVLQIHNVCVFIYVVKIIAVIIIFFRYQFLMKMVKNYIVLLF